MNGEHAEVGPNAGEQFCSERLGFVQTAARVNSETAWHTDHRARTLPRAAVSQSTSVRFRVFGGFSVPEEQFTSAPDRCLYMTRLPPSCRQKLSDCARTNLA
jgi:hypothetical protein